MKNLIGIISGDPNSINSEIIAKAWKNKKKLKSNILIIGNFNLLNKQTKILGYKLKFEKINHIKNHRFEKKLFVYDVPIKFKNPFNIPKKTRSEYILNCFKIAIKLIRKKKIKGLINCPINKKDILNKNYIGITEFLSKKDGVFGKEVMLIYNKELSVSPITTHIELSKVHKNISKNKIIIKTTIINDFFIKKFKKKPKIGILGLNPHNNELRKNSEENKIIVPAIRSLKRKKIKVYGPLSPDTAFLDIKKKDYDVVIGMYHDQVLAPFKALYKFQAINITLGLSFLRISPDHGVAKDLIKKNKANPDSLISAINFFKAK